MTRVRQVLKIGEETDRWTDIQTSVSPCSVVFEGLAACVGQLFIKHRLPASFSRFLISCCRKTVQFHQTGYWYSISVYWCSIFEAWCCISVYSCSILDLRSAYRPPPSLSLSLVVCLSWPPARRTSEPSGFRTERAPQTDTQNNRADNRQSSHYDLNLKLYVGMWWFILYCTHVTGEEKTLETTKLYSIWNYRKLDGPNEGRVC